MGNKRWYISLFFVLLVVLAGFFWVKSPLTNQDIRMAYVDSNGIVLKSISLQRRMVNIVRVSADVRVWIPGGMGWYESGKIERLLEQEKQLGKIDEILFYNFGFNPSIVRYSSNSSFREWWQISKTWGLKNYLTYLYQGGNDLMTKEEKVTGQLSLERDFLSVIMPRDFADSTLIEEAIKTSVYNSGSVTGLASMVARNLEWMGMTVYGVETVSKEEEKDVCRLMVGSNADNSKTVQYLRGVFSKCKFELESLLGEREVELYLTDKYAEVINYQSYNN